MDILEQLGLALGLAGLAGLNLYLTVFVVGLAVRFDFLSLADRFAAMEVLGTPIVLGVAGSLFLVEFFADKVPWVDTFWDTAHTFIRPVGGLLVALPALGNVDPALQVIGALLGGGIAATTHATKASTRVLINTSPEPVSNVTASVAEDATVLAGIGVIAFSPIIALICTVILVCVALYLLPRTIRIIRNSWGRIRGWSRGENLPWKRTFSSAGEA